MPTVIGSKQKQASFAKQLIAGTQKHLAAVTQVIVADGTFTPTQCEAKLQDFANLRADVEVARAVLQAKLVDERAKSPALRDFFLAYVGFVRAAYGGSPAILADFGLQPKKTRKPRTAEQLAAAKAKRDATRKARGTMGKKEKLSIKGDVTGVIVTPVTTPAPQPVVTHAPVAPPNGGAHPVA